ncbi:MAG: hypothetical protein NVSMB68_11860 [Thermoanaerobaculia bacterium]
MTARDHIDKVGIFGAAFAALCCLGVSAVLSVVSAIGLGFLANDAVLLPLLVVSLLVTAWGLVSGYRRHHNPAALVLGAAGGIGLLLFTFVHVVRPLAVASIVILVLASLVNVIVLRRGHTREPLP